MKKESETTNSKVDSSNKIKNLILIFASLTFLVPNLLYIIQGFFTRYRADDYCFSGILRDFGLINGLVEFYSFTSNRFSAFIFSGITELLGRNFIKIASPLSIIAFVYLINLVLTRLFSAIQINKSKKISFLISQVILFYVLYLAPNIHQSVFWRSGLSHYFLPIPLLLFQLVLLFYKKNRSEKKWIRGFCIFLLSFFSAGLSESYAALQMGIFGLALIWNFVSEKFRKQNVILLITALIATAGAMMVMIISPGNSLRLETLQQAPDLFSIISISFTSALNFLYTSIKSRWLPFTTLFGLVVSIAYVFIYPSLNKIQKRKLLIGSILSPTIVFLLVVCICAPTAYGMMAYPEQRVLMLAHTIQILGICVWAMFVGLLLANLGVVIGNISSLIIPIILILSIYPLTTLDQRYYELTFYKDRAHLWDTQNEEIREKISAGETDLSVIALDSFAEIVEMSVDKNFWVNKCAAQYYAINSIIAMEK